MTEQVRVLIADKMDPKAAAIFRERGIQVDEKPGLTPDELNEIIGDYDGVAVRSSTKIAGTYFHTFDRPGVYRYRCTIHINMDGTVVVR